MESLLEKNLNQLSDEELLKLDAELGKHDLYHLNTHILNFGRDLPDGEYFQMPEAEVGPVARWLMSPRPPHLRTVDRRKRALVVPRGTTKTSLAAGYVGARAFENPNIAVLWVSEEKKLANRVCSDLADRLTTEAVELRYGQLRGAKDWTFEHFTLATRVKKRKEPTLSTGGVDVPLQGWHFDLIICDDLIGLQSNTPEGIAKANQYLNLLWPILNPGGELLWIATRWDWDDVTARIIREWQKNPLSWEMLPVKRGYLGSRCVDESEIEFFKQPDGSCHFKVGDPIFPSILDEKVLEELKKDPPVGLGLYNFSCQYENNPLPSEAQEFHATDFKYVHDWSPADEADLDHPAREEFEGRDYYLAFDFASGEDEVRYGDDTTLAMIGVRGTDIRRDIVVVESQGGKWKPDETCDRLFLMAKKWRPRLIGLETNAMQKTYKWVIQDRMRNEGIYLPLRDLPRTARNSAADSIRRLQPLYRAGSIRHFRSLRNGPLEEQLLRFKPGGNVHDDYPTSLALAVELIEDGFQKSRYRAAGVRPPSDRRRRIRIRNSTVGGW